METLSPQTPTLSQPPLSDADRKHLSWVAWLHYLAGGFFALAGLVFLATLVLAAYIVIAKPPEASEPERIMAAKLLMVLSAILVASCWLPAVMLIVLGWLLGHCRAYRLCMWLTGLQSVLLLPIGPILGVYTYKVTNRPAVRAKFKQHQGEMN